MTVPSLVQAAGTEEYMEKITFSCLAAEAILFELTRKAGDDVFREISGLIK